jgi:hypothetical protein
MQTREKRVRKVVARIAIDRPASASRDGHSGVGLQRSKRDPAPRIFSDWESGVRLTLQAVAVVDGCMMFARK